MRTYAATLQLRTTLDQAGRVAGLAGELGVPESEVLRMLLDRALEPPDLLGQLRYQVAESERRQDAALAEFDAAHHRERRGAPIA